MKFIALTLIALATFSQAAYSAQLATLLYCNGKSPQPAQNSGEAIADAIVQITDKGTYMDISSLGAGLSPESPKMISGIDAAGSIVLHPEQPGQTQIEVLYTLNKYSGALSITNSADRDHKKILFTGQCNPAKPLF